MNLASPCRAKAVLMSTQRQNYPAPENREPRERPLEPIPPSALVITSQWKYDLCIFALEESGQLLRDPPSSLFCSQINQVRPFPPTFSLGLFGSLCWREPLCDFCPIYLCAEGRGEHQGDRDHNLRGLVF